MILPAWNSRLARGGRFALLTASLVLFLSAGSTTTTKRAVNMPTVVEVSNKLKDSHAPFVVLQSYWSREKALEAAEEAKRAIKECHQVVNLDYRRMGTNFYKGYSFAKEFADDAYLKSIASRFLGENVSVKAQYGITLRSGDSGDGWHQDIPTKVKGKVQKGFKALMYLQDVDEKRGPFQLLLNYNVSALRHKVDLRGRKTRYSDEHVYLQQEKYGAYVHKVLGEAGTVVLFEISNVHRGGVVEESGRISLTNYYNTPVEIAKCDEGLNVYSDLSEGHTSAVDRAKGLKLMNMDI